MLSRIAQTLIVVSLGCLGLFGSASNADAARRLADPCQQIKQYFILDPKLPHFLQIHVTYIDNQVTARVENSAGEQFPYMDFTGNGPVDVAPFQSYYQYFKKGENHLYVTGINQGYPRGGHDANPGRIDYVLTEDGKETIEPRSCREGDSRDYRSHAFFTHKYFYFVGTPAEWQKFKRSRAGRRSR